MSVRINDITFNAEYLSEPEDLQRGMMGRDSLDGCMVFKMGKGHHTFWMKGCKMALDIVFITGKKISKIHHNCPPMGNKLTPVRYSGIGDHVIEFPAGTAKTWKVGDTVAMYLGTPQNPV